MPKRNEFAKALHDNKYRQRVVSDKRRRVPYKEVIDDDWKTDGLEPKGYYNEIIEDDE
jgi:predicted DsbA family dithiol-disulfide isomerase